MGCNVILLVYGVVILLASQVSETESSITSLITDVTKSLEGVSGSDGAVDALAKLVKGGKYDKDGKLSKLLGSIKPAVKKIASGDGYQIASGCLDVLSGIAKAYGGPLGVPIGAVADLISNVLSMMNGKGSKNPSESMIDTALKKFREKSLRMQANGAKREFTESIAFVETLKKSKTITVTQLGILASNVPIYRASAFLGALEYHISHGAVANDVKEANKTVDIMLLYSELIVMREALLTDLCILYKRGNQDDIALAISNTIKINRKYADQHLKFLNDVSPDNAVIASLYYPVKHSFASEAIGAYKHFFGATEEYSTVWSGYYTISNVYYKGWSICNKGIKAIFRSCKKPHEQKIQIIPMKDGYSKLRSKSNFYLFVTATSEGWVWGTKSEDPGDDGYFNFIPLNSGSYLISTKKWPGYFVYMEASMKGFIRSWHGNPGPSGQWNLIP